MSSAEPNAQEMRYYDVKRNWTRKITPHLADKNLSEILTCDFNLYTMGRWARPFTPGMLPEDIENCDWRCRHRPPHPRFWRYVKHGACHWIVNFALRLAMLAEPAKDWRIVTSDNHSTVWDGGQTFFELNYLALDVSPDECWEIASNDGKVLEPGLEGPCNLASSYFWDYPDPQMALSGARSYLKQFIRNESFLGSDSTAQFYRIEIKDAITELEAFIRNRNRTKPTAVLIPEHPTLFGKLLGIGEAA